MTEERSPAGAVSRGVPPALGVSVAFLVSLVLIPVFIAAVVAVLAALTVGAVRTRAVPHAGADCLADHIFDRTARVVAPRAADSAIVVTTAVTTKSASSAA